MSPKVSGKSPKLLTFSWIHYASVYVSNTPNKSPFFRYSLLVLPRPKSSRRFREIEVSNDMDSGSVEHSFPTKNLIDCRKIQSQKPFLHHPWKRTWSSYFSKSNWMKGRLFEWAQNKNRPVAAGLECPILRHLQFGPNPHFVFQWQTCVYILVLKVESKKSR